jgi:hypothetical protein
MAEATPDKTNSKTFPSVDDVKPTEEGGPTARSGFSYQDEIAVGFLVEMLEDSSLLKVHCETHDDVLLVRAIDGSEMRLAEFVQVKATEPNKLWSLADICARKKGKANTSICEISLARDKHSEISRFRIVTLRPVVSDLKMLTIPFGKPGRETNGESFKALQLELDERFPKLMSPKGHGLAYWLENCLWNERHSEEAVREANLVRLLKLGEKENRGLLPEPAEVLMDELRATAKAAGDAKWEPNRDKKIFTREALRGWWERRTHELIEGATAPSGGKLREKMTQAGLPNELVELAIDMRRDYAATARTPRYMEVREAERLQSIVKSEVASLRGRFVAGDLDLDGAGFHSLCLNRMDALNAERPAGSEDRSAFLKGCLYDITDRCLLRFERPT